MTCIIAAVEGNTMYMAGDSNIYDGWNRRIAASRKMFDVREMLIGCSGYPRAAQLAEYYLEDRLPIDDTRSPMEYMVTGFIPAIRDLFKEHGYAEIANNEESFDSVLLVAYRLKLFAVETNFQVIDDNSPMVAIGSGRQYALGALTAMEDQGLSMEEKLHRSLVIAGGFSASVSPPYYVGKMEVGDGFQANT